MGERKYVAISIKHTHSARVPQFWGWKRTADDEERCYSSYTTNINKAELYSYEEFNAQYSWMNVQIVEENEFVPLFLIHRKKDTVLVDFEKYKEYMIKCGIYTYSVDEKFESLGWERTSQTYALVYQNESGDEIVFKDEKEKVELFTQEDEFVLDKDLLELISEKIKELGW